MTSTSTSLPDLRAVLADPDDDAPRLVYADAVGEAGDPARGELIVLQCALAAGTMDRTAAIAARRREHELLRYNQRRWSGLDRLAHSCSFRRGFVSEAHLDLDVLLGSADAIWAAAPLLDHVAVEGAADDDDTLAPLEKLIDSPIVSRLRGLHLGGLRRRPDPYGDRDSIAGPPFLGGPAIDLVVARAARLGRLRALGVSEVTRGAQALAGCRELGALEALHLDGPLLGGTADALLDSPHLPRLRELRLHGGARMPLASLLAHPRAAELRVLGFSWLTTHTLLPDVQAPVPRLERLERFEVAGAADASVLGLLGRVALPRLRELVVRGTALSPNDARTLAAWAEDRGLELLDLSACSQLAGMDDQLVARFRGHLLMPWTGHLVLP